MKAVPLPVATAAAAAAAGAATGEAAVTGAGWSAEKTKGFIHEKLQSWLRVPSAHLK